VRTKLETLRYLVHAVSKLAYQQARKLNYRPPALQNVIIYSSFWYKDHVILNNLKLPKVPEFNLANFSSHEK
jgi:hypothetical protein